MKLRVLAATLAALTLVAGTAVAQDTTTESGKLSYALGYDYGQSLHGLIARGDQIDINALVKGIQDAHAKREGERPQIAAAERPISGQLQTSASKPCSVGIFSCTATKL